MRYVYPCILHPEVGGGYYVTFTDVRGALTCGDDRTEALEMAEDALIAALGAYFKCNEEIPFPSPVELGQEAVVVPPVPAAKLALHAAMRDQSITQSELGDMMGMDETAVRKLLDPDRYSHINTITKALRAVGRGLVTEDFALAV